MTSWLPTVKIGLAVLNWLVAAGWLWRVATTLKNLPGVPDLLDPKFDAQVSVAGAGIPEVCIIVPARNEAESIALNLHSLLALRGPNFEIIAVDDRSSDTTGAIMDSIARENAGTLQVIQVTDLPSGWLGKPHAMALAARQATAPWLLFTDGDVIFREDALRRALDLCSKLAVDHLVVFPTLILESMGERMMIGFFYAALIWGARPWRVSDPKAKGDFAGIGAFNLIRREVYAAVGGYESLRMEVLDDVRLGFAVKRKGYRQQMAFGRNLIRIHWARGALGIVHNLTKNIFALFRFRPLVVLAAWLGLFVITILPALGLFGGTGMRSASLATFLLLGLLYWRYRRHSGIPIAYALTFPVAATLALYAILRSMIVTLARGGIDWRGTRYPLKELRKQAGSWR
jgi:glycosyltransferase involved in cell wall biosynthesis